MAEDMSRTEPRPRLGRGLAALLGAANEEAAEFAGGARKMPIEFLRPNPRNPRKRFDDAELDELAASIKERGIIQPVVVRPIPRVADAYEIIAGERRWRAAQRAGRHDIPVVVVEAGDREALEIAIVENVSAPISMRSRKPRATPSSAPTTAIRTATSPASSARAGAMSPTPCG